MRKVGGRLYRRGNDAMGPVAAGLAEGARALGLNAAKSFESPLGICTVHRSVAR